jgi:hypothetical protein
MKEKKDYLKGFSLLVITLALHMAYNVAHSYSESDIQYQRVMDIQSSLVLHLNGQASKLLNISGSGAQRLQGDETKLSENGRYVAWKQNYAMAKSAMKINRSAINGKSQIMVSPLTFPKLTAKATLQYGVQTKHLNITLLGYVIEVSPIRAGKPLNVDFKGGCIIWQHKIGGVTQALVQAGCHDNMSYTVKDNAQPWQESIKTTYYGIKQNELKQLRGGKWVLSNTAISTAAQNGAKHIQVSTLSGFTKIAALNAPTLLTKNSQYFFQFNAHGFEIVIPITTSFRFTNNHTNHLNVNLSDSHNPSGDFISKPAQDAKLHYSTNQSINGVRYSIECDNETTYNGKKYCALTDDNKAKTKNAIKLFFSECNASGYCSLKKPQALDLNKPIKVETDLGDLYTKVYFVAPGLSHNQPGKYAGLVRIMANATF